MLQVIKWRSRPWHAARLVSAPMVRIKRWQRSQKPAAVRQRRSRAQRKRDRTVFNVALSRRLVEHAVRVREKLPPGTRLSKRQLEKASPGVSSGGLSWSQS